MIDPIVGGLVFAAILTGGTKTGRGAAAHTGKTLGRATKNAATAGYAATGWRTPGKALEHHAGRAGARIGQVFAGAMRKIERHAADRWKVRADLPPDKRPQMVRWLVDTPARPATDDTEREARQAGPPPNFGRPAPRGRPAARTSEPRPADGIVHPDPVMPPELTPATIEAIKAHFVAEFAEDKVRPEEIVVKPNGDVWIDRRKTTSWAKPMLIGKWTPPAPDRPTSDQSSSSPSAQGSPRPDGPGRDTTTTATGPHLGAEGSTTTVARFGISLEPPNSDAEFLATLIDIGDALKAVADEIEGWAEHITGMGLPSSVTTSLNAIPEGLTEAAQGAGRAASAFEDEFEEAREVASRGLKITGRDAA